MTTLSALSLLSLCLPLFCVVLFFCRSFLCLSRSSVGLLCRVGINHPFTLHRTLSPFIQIWFVRFVCGRHSSLSICHSFVCVRSQKVLTFWSFAVIYVLCCWYACDRTPKKHIHCHFALASRVNNCSMLARAFTQKGVKKNINNRKRS